MTQEVTIILRETVNIMTLENGHQAREGESHVLVEPTVKYFQLLKLIFMAFSLINQFSTLIYMYNYNITSWFKESI